MPLEFGPVNPVAALNSVFELWGQNMRAAHEKKRDERQFAHNRQMSEYQWSKDLEQWNRANEYNAPTAQMERLREAGLNPAMIYGSGGAKTVAAQLPKYQAAKADYRYSAPFDPTNVLAAYQNFQIGQAKAKQEIAKAEYAPFMENAKADKALYDSLQSLYQSQAMGPDREQFKDAAFNPLIRRIMKQRLASMETSEKKDKSQKDLIDTEAAHYIYQLYGRMGINLINSITGGIGKVAGGIVKGATRKVSSQPQLGPRYNSSANWDNLTR